MNTPLQAYRALLAQILQQHKQSDSILDKYSHLRLRFARAADSDRRRALGPFRFLLQIAQATVHHIGRG